jgi:hypothetical protein
MGGNFRDCPLVMRRAYRREKGTQAGFGQAIYANEKACFLKTGY